MMKLLLTVLVLTLPLSAVADTGHGSFPAAATRYIDSEMPGMEAAIAANDRTYFMNATNRLKAFLNEWNTLTPGNSILEQHAACASAVTDFLIVGLCKMPPGGGICEPTTFFPKFEKNRAECRADARD